MGLLFIVFNAGFFISIREIFLSSAGKQTAPPFWFVVRSSSLIPNQFDLGVPIVMCLPKVFLSNHLSHDPSIQTLCEEELCLN